MKISIIAAVSDNNVIGKDNKLLWRLSNDLKRFKKLTTSKVVIMGQNTYESLPIKPLPNRVNIVITNDSDIYYDNCDTVNGIDHAINRAKYWAKDDEIFIIGGGSVYKQFFNISNKLYITKVHHKFDGDTFFPEINSQYWNLISEEKFKKDDKNEYDYSYLIYERK